MAQISLSLPAPSQQTTSLVVWGSHTPGTTIGDLADLAATADATLLRRLAVQNAAGFSERMCNLETTRSSSEDPDVAGPELTDAWEGSPVAVVLRAPTLPDLTIIGPASSGLTTSDTSDPYSWQLSTTQDAAAYTNGTSSGIGGWISDFDGLSSAQQGMVTLVMDDNVSAEFAHLGTAGIAKAYLGSTEVTKIYLGSTEIL